MPESWVGKRIGGRYQIDSLLGQGGMSAVYRAIDPNLRRMVAIKLIHTHLSTDPNFVNRFKEEAAAVARLRHPNIVQVHDFDVDGDTYYMVMEYLMGETLQARIKRLKVAGRFMSYPDVISIATQLCDAVGYAHNHELIHRDIKPANVMLDVNGQAILMDFGIVKIIGGEYHTSTGATVGTAMYMSPEQIRSERVDERSDIYSMGVTLYEMISGRTPFQADSALTVMMMVLNDPLPDLHEVRIGTPENLLVVVEKALKKERKDRFQSMEEMAAALKQAKESISDTASEVTVVDDEQITTTSLPDELRDIPAQIEETKTKSEGEGTLRDKDLEAEELVPEFQREEQRISTIRTLEDLPIKPASTPQQSVSSKVRDRTKPNNRRVFFIGAVLLMVSMLTAAGIIYFQSQKPPIIQVTPINQPIVPINADTAQFLVSLANWATSSFIDDLDYSPNGSMIGTANNKEVAWYAKYRTYGCLWQVNTNHLYKYLLGHTQPIYSVSFSPDGQLFATASDDGSIILWHVSDGGKAREIEPSSGGISSVDFSPNNILLAAGTGDGNVGLWDVRDGHLLRTLEGHKDSITDVKFSPDGALLASASDDQTIKVWQVSDGSLVYTLTDNAAPIHKLAFSPDGNQLASASEDSTIEMWQLKDGNLIRSLQGHSEAVYDLTFSPDGSLLASGSGDGTLRLWRTTDGELLKILPEHQESITTIAFSPDGYMLVSGATDGVIRFWGISEAIPIEIETPNPSSGG